MLKFFGSIMILIFLSGCNFLHNPYVQEIEIHQMKIEQGKEQALIIALNAAHKERLEIEKQYQEKIFEYNTLITAYVRVTGQTPEEIRTSKVLSTEYMINEKQYLKNNIYKRQKEINKSYNDFFNTLKEYDLKIESLEAVKKSIKENDSKMYIEAAKIFSTTIISQLIFMSL